MRWGSSARYSAALSLDGSAGETGTPSPRVLTSRAGNEQGEHRGVEEDANNPPWRPMTDYVHHVAHSYHAQEQPGQPDAAIQPERGEDEDEAAAEQPAVGSFPYERDDEDCRDYGDIDEHGVRGARTENRHFQADRRPDVSGLAPGLLKGSSAGRGSRRRRGPRGGPDPTGATGARLAHTEPTFAPRPDNIPGHEARRPMSRLPIVQRAAVRPRRRSRRRLR